jgi:hypothetical protein
VEIEQTVQDLQQHHFLREHADAGCRHDFEWARRLRDLATYGVIGQSLWPLTKVSILGYGDFYALNAQEEFGRDGTWEMTVDVTKVRVIGLQQERVYLIVWNC